MPFTSTISKSILKTRFKPHLSLLCKGVLTHVGTTFAGRRHPVEGGTQGKMNQWDMVVNRVRVQN
jgi:hypothetical protein